MTDPESRMESFVVRIWLERREIPNAFPEWRGVIEHVASGKRKYILDLDTVVIFMAEYMHGWGVQPKSGALARHQLCRFYPLEWFRQVWQRFRRSTRGQGAWDEEGKDR